MRPGVHHHIPDLSQASEGRQFGTHLQQPSAFERILNRESAFRFAEPQHRAEKLKRNPRWNCNKGT
jgi:hypothetical protein